MSSNLITLPDHWPHGGGIEAVACSWKCDVSEVLDLSTGLHPAGSPIWLGSWLNEHAGLVGHYPDSSGEPARSVLAQEFNVSPENVLITAGAQAVIEVVFQSMDWQSMSIQVPCYSEPIRCAKRAGCHVRAFESGLPPAADILWLTSPSNPTGEREWPLHDTSHLIPEMICLDESYMPFSQRRTLKVIPHMIRIGSLTKTFCIPGLRLGYVIATKEDIQQINSWLPPWPASTLAQHLLPKLLPEADRRDEQIIVSRQRLAELLKKNDWRLNLSQASFLLAFSNDAMPSFEKHRILVRQFPEWPQLAGWIRFGLPGCEPAWQRLEKALCR